MNTLRTPTVSRDTEIQCDATWFSPGGEDWNRGLPTPKRRERLSVHVQRIPGRGLLITEIPGSSDMTIAESAWIDFLANDTKEQLVASDGEIELTFTRADLSKLIPGHWAEIVPFPRRTLR